MTRELARLILEHSPERGTARFTLSTLALLADEWGDVEITNPALAKLIGLEIYTARHYIRALMRSGSISRLIRGHGNRPSRYHVNAPKGPA